MDQRCLFIELQKPVLAHFEDSLSVGQLVEKKRTRSSSGEQPQMSRMKLARYFQETHVKSSESCDPMTNRFRPLDTELPCRALISDKCFYREFNAD